MSRVISWVAALSLLSCTPIEPEKGYGYLCSRETGPADQCPGDFHCGLEGRCLKNQPGTYQCESDIDCYGWHCGVEQRCYDLIDAGAVACARDENCDRAGGWQCGPDGVCTDTSLERPRAATDDLLEFRLATRELWAGEPTFAEFAAVRTEFPDGGVCDEQTIWVGGTENVTRITVPGLMPSCSKKPTWLPVFVGRARAIANSEGALVALTGSQIFQLSLSGGVPSESRIDFAAAVGLRVDPRGWTAFGPDSIYRHEGDAGWFVTIDAGVIRDVAFVGSPGASDYRLAVLSDDFRTAAMGPAGPLLPLQPENISGNAICTSASGSLNRLSYTDLSLAAFDYRAQLFMSVTSDGGCVDSASPWSMARVAESPVGQFECRPTFVDTTSGLRGECVTNDGSVQFWPHHSNGSARAIDGHITAASRSRLVDATYAGRFPELHVQRSGSQRSPSPALWTGPTEFTTVVDGVTAVWANRSAEQGGLVGLVGNGLIASAPIPFPGLAFGIRGAPELVGITTPSGITLIDLGRFEFASLPEDDLIDDVVTVASSAPLPDGRSLVLFGRGDVVSHILVQGVAPASIAVRNGFAPAPRLHVRAIDLAEDLLGAEYAGGYVVAGGRVFRFTADNPIVWKSTELEVGGQEAIDVWHDGPRARVGLRDGTVVALPSRVPISSQAHGVARHFLQVCERLFVATYEGVEVLLVEPGATAGTWKPIVTKPGASRLHYGDHTLSVFFDDGSYGEIPVLDCAD